VCSASVFRVQQVR